MAASGRSVLQDKIDDIDPTVNAVEDRPVNGVPGGIADNHSQRGAKGNAGLYRLFDNGLLRVRFHKIPPQIDSDYDGSIPLPKGQGKECWIFL